MERSNTYIFIYSVVLVIVVAAVLSFTAFSLKDKQNANVRIEKMQNILNSIGIQSDTKTAEADYNKYIVETFIVKPNGEKLPYIVVKEGKSVDTVTAFDIDMTKLYKLDRKDRTLPVFVANKNDSTFIILPLRGKGLWGPVWGYISLSEDINTVSGAVFDHKGETPGLGAEISKEKFSSQFKDKQIFDESGNFTSIKVIKGGAGDNIHGVDAISGGTITSTGVNNMLDTCLSGYVKYFESIK